MYSTFKNHYYELFNNHHIYNINSIDNNTFTYYCQERKHNDKLEYYWIDNNMLCSETFLCKIKGIGNCSHNKCKMFYIPKIKDKKKSSLLEIMKY